jgi:hypothetical protein
MKRYAALAPGLTFRFVDPEKEPQGRRPIRRHATGTCGTKRNGEGADRGRCLRRVREGEITSLVLKVSRPGGKRIYAITGHGEPELTDGDAGRYGGSR